MCTEARGASAILYATPERTVLSAAAVGYDPEEAPNDSHPLDQFPLYLGEGALLHALKDHQDP